MYVISLQKKSKLNLSASPRHSSELNSKSLHVLSHDSTTRSQQTHFSPWSFLTFSLWECGSRPSRLRLSEVRHTTWTATAATTKATGLCTVQSVSREVSLSLLLKVVQSVAMPPPRLLNVFVLRLLEVVRQEGKVKIKCTSAGG